MRVRRRVRSVGVCVAAATVLVASPASYALLQSCSVSASGVSFGPYDPSSSQANTATGTVTVSCSVTLIGLLASWTLSLSPGSSASYTSRSLVNGASTLQYNLFNTPSYSTVWGNGSGATGVVSDGAPLLIGNNSYTYTVYGRIPPLQDVRTGSYSDSIVVTIDY